MKFIPVALSLAALLLSPGFTEARAQSDLNYREDPESYRPVPLFHSVKSSGSSFLPQWITDYFPSAVNIFNMNANFLIGTPYQVLIYTLDKVCGVASSLGFLQQDYVPEDQYLELKLYVDNNIVTAPLENPSALLESEFFDKTKNVTVFVTGFEASEYPGIFGSVHQLKEAYSRRGGNNFIVFDIGRAVENLYQWINLNVVYLGGELGNALTRINSQIPGANIHVIGHSVGAHIAGVAGNRFHRSTGEQIARITGLDPASPCLKSGSNLQKGDAAFVDIIHSSSGALGVSDAVADVDFYPNGRVPLQPGCLDVMCSHKRAIEYFIESVYPGGQDSFPAQRCASVHEFTTNNCQGKTTPMGYATPSTVRGLYYLQTNAKSPYGKNSE